MPESSARVTYDISKLIDSWARDPRASASTIWNAIEDAIQHEGVNQLIKLLMNGRQSLLAGLPDELYSKSMNMICSDLAFPDWFRYRGLTTEQHIRLFRGTPQSEAIEEFLRVVKTLGSWRRSARRLSAEDYGHLLRASHLTGNVAFAKETWSQMMQDNVSPNLACFSNFLGAHVSNDLSHAYRSRSRVTNFNMMARDNFYAGPPFDNYKIGENGIKEVTEKLFGEMLRSGLDADEEMICHVITGLAREGDVKGFQAVLGRTWDIDPYRIMRDDDREPRTEMDRSSPLFPSARLLHTLTFCYGINRDLSTGMRVVDYTSRHFDIKITDGVWDRLLDWSYILSRRTTPHQQDPRPVLRDAVFAVWTTMTGEPYNVEPTVGMWNIYIRTLFSQFWPEELVGAIQSGYKRFMADYSNHIESRDELEALIENGSHPLAIEKRMRHISRNQLAISKGSLMIRHWIKLLIMITRDESKYPQNGSPVATEALPAMMSGEMRRFFPRVIRYDTPTGHVAFQRLEKREAAERHLSDMRHVTYRRWRAREQGCEWVGKPYTNAGVAREFPVEAREG